MAMTTRRNSDLTEGTIWKQILAFFFPIMVGTFFQQLYNTVDSVIVGQYAGKEALSCVGGSSAQIINLVVGFFTGLTSGCSVVIAQYFGAKKEKELHMALHTAYAFAILGGLFFGVLGMALSPWILRMMNTPQELIADSAAYIRIYFSGLIFIFIYNMGSAMLRAIGDSRRPLYYLIICCLLNIVLDLFFVLFLNLSVIGVAIATWIAQAVSAGMVTVYLIREKGAMHLELTGIRFYPESLRRMLLIGLPSGFQSVMYSFSNMIVQRTLNGFGVDTMAAWTALGKLDNFFWMINNAMGVTAVTFIGQNYGARKKDRIRRGVQECLGLEMLFAVLLSSIMLTFGPVLFTIFTKDQAVIAIGMEFVYVISTFYGIFTFIEILSAALRAEGYVLVPSLITMLGVCLLRIIWIVFLVPGGSREQVAFCYPLTWIVSAVAMSAYYLYKQPKILKQFMMIS